MTVVEELDAAIARARGERVGVTDEYLASLQALNTLRTCGCAGRRLAAADVFGCYCDCAENGYEGCEHDPEKPAASAAWADPSVTDATVAVWQALRDEYVCAEVDPDEGDLWPLEAAVLAQVRAYMNGANR